jgi:glycosyltransferase involved in cell wall biosynthesis
MTPAPNLSICMPCFNEAKVIRANTERVLEEASHVESRLEVILCNDGSRDHTQRELDALASTYPEVVAIGYEANLGAGHAFRRALDVARGTYVVHMDADLAMAPGDVCATCLDRLQRQRWDVAIASRYLGIAADYPLRRSLPSRSYRALYRFLFRLPVTDAMSGFFGFRRDILHHIPPLRSDGFELYLELFAKAKAQGFTLTEFPAKFVHQTESGEVSVLRTAPRQLAATLRVWRDCRMTG